MSFFFLLQWLELVWKFPSTVAFRVGWPMDKTSVIQSLMIELLAWHTRNLVSNPCFAWSRADFFFFCSKPLLCFNLSDLNLGLHVPNAIPQPSGYGIFVLRWKHFYLNLSFADKETYEIIFVWWRSVLRWNEFLENRTIQQLVLWSCPLPCLKYTQIGRAIGTWDHPWPRVIFKRRSTKQLQVK